MPDLSPDRFVNVPDLKMLFKDRRKMQVSAQRAAVNAGRLDAELTFSLLAAKLDEFQARLPEDQEVGLFLANFGQNMHIREIGFKNPNLIEFRGIDEGGNEIEVVQHVSQLNFIFRGIMAVDAASPYRIGFIQEEAEPDDKKEGE